MRYLKRINEEELGGNGCPLDNEKDIKELSDIAEPFLLPLMDDGKFKVLIQAAKIQNNPFVIVGLLSVDGLFRWDEVKDSVVPMFHKLAKDYDVDSYGGGSVMFLDNAGKPVVSKEVVDVVFNDLHIRENIRGVLIKLYQKRNYWGIGARRY